MKAKALGRIPKSNNQHYNNETNCFIRKRVALFAALLLAGFLLFVLIVVAKSNSNAYQYVPIKPLATHNTGHFYSGSQVCNECHSDIYKSHVLTPHFKTSAIANNKTIKGLQSSSKDALYLNDSITIRVVDSNNQIFQIAHYGKLQTLLSKDQIDIVIGSGKRGQSFLTWIDNDLYQLQISYYTPTDKWINSPGYQRDTISDLRPIESACIVCHSTFMRNRDYFGEGNSYDRSQVVLGVDCERCHGPSAKHVSHHREYQNSVEAAFMVKYDTLNRKQRLDICALCHSGIREQEYGDPYSFIIGDNLDDYSRENQKELNYRELDVHGNQYGLLKESKCFQNSPTMDCVTCHNPHKNQSGNSNYFNAICINCHQSNKMMCANDKSLNFKSDNSCISCHMPLIDSKSLKLQMDNNDWETPLQFRSHLIGIHE